MFLQQLFYGFLLVAVGTVTLKFNFQIVNNTTRLDWFESHLGAGSTFLIYKLLSIGLVFSGILMMTGLGGPFLNWLSSPLRTLFNIKG